MDGGHRLLRCRGQPVCVHDNNNTNNDTDRNHNARSDDHHTDLQRDMSDVSLSVSLYCLAVAVRNNQFGSRSLQNRSPIVYSQVHILRQSV